MQERGLARFLSIESLGVLGSLAPVGGLARRLGRIGGALGERTTRATGEPRVQERGIRIAGQGSGVAVG